MDKQQKIQAPMIGGSSLLVIFAVLCLTIFALLGLSSVQADKRLSDASAQAVTEYYAADCRAEEILAELRTGNVPAGVTYADGIYSFACPISVTQELQAEVRITENDYEILRWQAVYTASWDYDDSIEVWDGES